MDAERICRTFMLSLGRKRLLMKNSMDVDMENCYTYFVIYNSNWAEVVFTVHRHSNWCR